MDQIYELLAIMLGAILANNFIFSQFLGCCPFLGFGPDDLRPLPAQRPGLMSLAQGSLGS